MTEMVTSGSMSGGARRSDGLLGESGHERRRSQQAPPVLYATARVLDSTEEQNGHDGGVSEVDSHGQQAFAARDVSGAGAPRMARGAYHEWAERVDGTSPEREENVVHIANPG